MPLISSRSASHRAVTARDAGLRKISLTTRALVVGSVAATGVFSSLAAWAQPGRSKPVRTAGPVAQPDTGSRTGFRTGSTSTSAPTTPAPTGDNSGGDDNDNLAPPATAPATVPVPAYQYTPPPVQYSPPVAVSGAS
jgi:hypothetical protein